MSGIKITQIFIYILGLATGIVFYQLYVHLSDTDGIAGAEKHQGSAGFINPLLDCMPEKKILKFDFFSVERRLKKFVSDLERQSGIERISVYYRDLNNGPGFGANEHREFLPGSLLKIPVMIRHLKAAETQPELLKTKSNCKIKICCSFTTFRVQLRVCVSIWAKSTRWKSSFAG